MGGNILMHRWLTVALTSWFVVAVYFISTVHFDPPRGDIASLSPMVRAEPQRVVHPGDSKLRIPGVVPKAPVVAPRQAAPEIPVPPVRAAAQAPIMVAKEQEPGQGQQGQQGGQEEGRGVKEIEDDVIRGSTWPPFDARALAKRRQEDPNFPPKQPASQCEARGQNGGRNDLNKKLLKKVKVEPDNADGHTIFCMVYTIKKNHATAAKAVRDTWGSRCDGFLVMSDTEDPDLPAARVVHEGPEAYGNIWQKVRAIWKYVHLAYGDQFDWFMIGGDDLFIVPSNLRAYLHSDRILEASEYGSKPMFLGRRFQIPRGQLFNSGGAGYALNKPALDLLVANLDNPQCRPHQKVFAEDVNVASCLAKFGVEPFDTRDEVEGERFHPFTPGLHLSWRPARNKRPDGSSPDWYENYNAPWGVQVGDKCCSENSVSFHYVKPPLQYHLSALLHDCRET